MDAGRGRRKIRGWRRKRKEKVGEEGRQRNVRK